MLQYAPDKPDYHELICGVLWGGSEHPSRNWFASSATAQGSKIAINKRLAATIPAREAILGVLVQAMSELFASTYYKAKGILPLEPGQTGELGTR